MHDDDYALTESVDDLPRKSIPTLPQASSDAAFISLLPKALTDQWVIFAIIVLLVPMGLLVLDLGFGYDLMAENSRARGSAGRNEDSTWFLVAMCVVSFLGASLTFFIRYIVIRRIQVHGVDVPCQIIDKGKHIYKGLIDVTLQYEYAGQTYRPRISIAVDHLGQLNHIRINSRMPSEYWVDW